MFWRKRSRKAVLTSALTSTRTTLNRLSEMIRRVDARRQYLEEKVVEYLSAGRKDLAERYAAEAAQMRRLLRELRYMEAAIERVALRIETVLNGGEMLSVVSSAIGVVEELKNSSVAAIPEVALELNSVEESLREAIGEASYPDAKVSYHVTLDDEARKVLEEARVVAEDRVPTPGKRGRKGLRGR